MPDVFRTIIVPADHVDLARDISEAFGAAYADNFRTGLSADAKEPASHFVTTGYLGMAYVKSLPLHVYEQTGGAWEPVSSSAGDPANVYAWCADGQRVGCTAQQVVDLFDACDVTEQPPFTAFARMGLQIVQPENMELTA